MSPSRIGLVGVMLLCACGAGEEPVHGPRLAIGVAPLQLDGVSDACYALTVFSGTSSSDQVVWSEERVCATRFGDARGSLAYVGTCDASASGGSGESLVRLVMEDLCAGGPCADSTPGPTSIDAAEWRNPCPGPDGCTQTAFCRENEDVPVTFDLVVARSAFQGFFDIAVEFSDVFCSAKLDCVDDDGGPLLLLHDPDNGERGPTVVVAWACTAGPGADTWLYFDNLVFTCFDGDEVIGSWAYDPSLGPGNMGPGDAPFVFQSASYRTVAAHNGIASWSVALGIHPAALPGRCVLTAQATASDEALDDETTAPGAIYPFVGWNVTLSEEAGALSCGVHPLDGGNGVATDYVRGAPKTFSHALHAADEQVTSHGRIACGNVVESLGGAVTFASSPEGITARIGADQSGFYRLRPEYRLGGCCGDACCQ